MKFKVLEAYKKNGNIVVLVEHIYGKDRLGLNPESEYINPETNKPKWLNDVAELLERKYGGQNKVRVDLESDVIGQEIESSEFNLNKTRKIARKGEGNVE